MKIAVISDIHSNLMALDMAIADAIKMNVSKFVFLGDYITDGEDGNHVVNIVRELSCDVVLGNREKYILNYETSKRDYQNYRTISNTFDSLSVENFKYIKKLDTFKIIEVGIYKILLLHGDEVSHLDEGLNNIFDKIIEMYDFDICLFGHSHKYVNKKYKDKYFINPGSIGLPTDTPSYKYCIIEIGEDINVILREFKTCEIFDVFKEKYLNSFYYKDSPIWGGLILNTIRDGKDYCEDFMTIFKYRINNKNYNINEYNKILAKTYQEFSLTLNEFNYDLWDEFIKKNDLVNIEKFFEYCKNNINSFNEINDCYILKSPLEVLKHKNAYYFDAVELYRRFFNLYMIKYETYFIRLTFNNNILFERSLFIYYDNRKIYWFEPIFEQNIYEFDDLESLFSFIKNKYEFMSTGNYICDIYKYIEPKYGISRNDFYKHCEMCIKV